MRKSNLSILAIILLISGITLVYAGNLEKNTNKIPIEEKEVIEESNSANLSKPINTTEIPNINENTPEIREENITHLTRNEKITGEVVCIGECGTPTPLAGPPSSQEKVYIYANNNLVGSIADDKINYYHLDQLGSIRAITNDQGQIIFTTEYEPFGSNFATVGDSSYQYTGKEKEDTDLYYYGARYYDSSIGRFTQVDPILSIESSPYVYVNNNPLRYIDPNGEEPKEINPLQIKRDPITLEYRTGVPGIAPSILVLLAEATRYYFELKDSKAQGEQILQTANENFWKSLGVNLNRPVLEVPGASTPRPLTEDLLRALTNIHENARNTQTSEEQTKLRKTWKTFLSKTEDRRGFDDRGFTLDGKPLDTKYVEMIFDTELLLNTPLPETHPSQGNEIKIIEPEWRILQQ